MAISLVYWAIVSKSNWLKDEQRRKKGCSLSGVVLVGILILLFWILPGMIAGKTFFQVVVEQVVAIVILGILGVVVYFFASMMGA